MSIFKRLFSSDAAKPSKAEKLVGAAPVRVRCAGCDAVYTIGVDTVCMTLSMGMQSARVAMVFAESFQETLMLALTDPGNQYIHSDEATILRLGPKIGWQCHKCQAKNRWQPLAAS